MNKDDIYTSIFPWIQNIFIEDLKKFYWKPLYEYILNNTHLINRFPAFLLHHEKVIIYIGKTHIAVEYIGSEIYDKNLKDNSFTIEVIDYTKSNNNLFEDIVGFKYDSTTDLEGFPLVGINENLVFPTNKGYQKLSELSWNFGAQDSILAFNISAPKPKENYFARVVNGLFFDADDAGLKTRHIKWLDFYPLEYDDSDSEIDILKINIAFLQDLVEHDAEYIYPIPKEFKLKQLPKINRFIELWGDIKTTEPTITSFLAKEENKFILTMKFGAKDIYSELECVWQSENKDNIKPDFFILQPNGYADIIEFKLPTLDKNFIVGKNNRESFASFLNSYISQTRVYSMYFDDPNNRTWFEQKYGFKVHKPRRWLVVGRRNNFESDVWREIISDYKDIEIITYDDLIDGVVAQFYRS